MYLSKTSIRNCEGVIEDETMIIMVVNVTKKTGRVIVVKFILDDK